MPEIEISSSGINTIAEVKRMARPFEMDLIAYFTQLEDDIFKLIEQSEEKEWTEEKLLSMITNLTR